MAPATRTPCKNCKKIPPEKRKEIHAEVLEFVPEGKLNLTGGCSNEMLRVLLEDKESLLYFHAAAEDFARAVPASIFKAFMMANMTALQKRDGGVRGIATGTAFRRLVARTLARQFSTEVEAACTPFQFALSTRAGVDCVGHAVRAATDANKMTTVLSVDGIGAYDHTVLR